MNIAQKLSGLNDRFENGVKARHEAFASEVETFEREGPRFTNPVLRALENFNHHLNLGYARAFARPLGLDPTITGSPEAFDRIDPDVDQVGYVEFLDEARKSARVKTEPIESDEDRRLRLAEQYIHDVNPGLYDIDRTQFNQDVAKFVFALTIGEE